MTWALALHFLMFSCWGMPAKEPQVPCSVAQRSHLLNQFHLSPSKDRRLMGFLFDVQQRSHVIKGVKAHVESNKGSIRVFKELMASDTLRAELRQAVKFSFSHSSKKLLRKYLSHLQFSSKNVSYGALEGVGLKHWLMGNACRYSAPNNIFHDQSCHIWQSKKHQNGSGHQEQ